MKQERKNLWWLLTFSLLASLSYGSANAYEFVEKDSHGTTHIRAPFVHVDVHHKANGEKNVSVDAPFTHVRHPAGGNRVQVRAPFTKINPQGEPNVHVRAPFTKVMKQPDGSLHARAPVTNVNKPKAMENVKVVAPSTKDSKPNLDASNQPIEGQQKGR
jgi:hypothetical protein